LGISKLGKNSAVFHKSYFSELLLLVVVLVAAAATATG
jgi:hypothetical protein